jgi:hypothetical protein
MTYNMQNSVFTVIVIEILQWWSNIINCLNFIMFSLSPIAKEAFGTLRHITLWEFANFTSQKFGVKDTR